ncbi:unnamed protein product [Brassica oleracea]
MGLFGYFGYQVFWVKGLRILLGDLSVRVKFGFGSDSKTKNLGKYPEERFSFDYYFTLFNWKRKKARGIIPMAKVAAPNMALKVLDTAVQVHGAACLSSDTVLAHLWATTARTLRIADGADEVHLGTIGKLEQQRASKL